MPRRPLMCIARALALLVLGVALAGGVRAGSLDPVEQRIVAAVQARSAAALDLLQRSVSINSGTLNAEGVRAVGVLFAAELQGLGFATRWVEMPSAMQRAGHLVAEREGRRGQRVLLIGHLDTVFEKDSPVPPWSPQGARVRGQGVSDMKGGDVIVIEALRALHAAGALDDTRIVVVFTGDEERVGRPIATARAELIAAAQRSDVALAFEGTVPDAQGRATGTVGRRASGGWTLEVKARQGHSAGVFGDGGHGAIYEAARILDAFRTQVAEPGLTFNVGLIAGGTEVAIDDSTSRASAFGKTNIIAPAAQVRGDLRYRSAEQGERARARMREIVARSLAGAQATIRFSETYPPMAPTAANLALLAQYSQASEDAGLGAVAALPPDERGAGDVQFVAPHVTALDGLGATGRGAHSPDEDLEPASIERATIRTAVLLYRLTR